MEVSCYVRHAGITEDSRLVEVNRGRAPVEVVNITGRARVFVDGGNLVRHRRCLGGVEEVVGAQDDGVLELETMLSSGKLM